MSFVFYYTEDNGNIGDTSVINITDPDINLTQLFLNFAELTRMAGFAAGSWEKVIADAYKYCVKHKDAPANYTLYDWATDCRFGED